jgi:transcriptional regulator with XRE-family HTH domain
LNYCSWHWHCSQRLGAELRKLREHAGLTSSAAAGLLGLKQAQISSLEAGRYAVSADRVRTFARAHSSADPALVDALAAMTGGRKRGRWDEYRGHLPVGFIDLAELEHCATELRVALVIHIPALLQTSDHARALFRGLFPPLQQYEIEHRLTHRMKRQGILHRDEPTPYTATIHETALRMGFGGRDVAVKQLRAHHRHERTRPRDRSSRPLRQGELPRHRPGHRLSWTARPSCTSTGP